MGVIAHITNSPLINCPEIGTNQNLVSGWKKQWEKHVHLSSTEKGWTVLVPINATSRGSLAGQAIHFPTDVRISANFS